MINEYEHVEGDDYDGYNRKALSRVHISDGDHVSPISLINKCQTPRD